MAESGAKVRNRQTSPHDGYDWRRIAYLVQLSRAMDKLEEERLVPERKILYQFSARGHDMAQAMLGSRLTHRRDATCGYYRSRPLLLALGVPVEDALGSGMGREGGYSDGRDIGVVFNYPNPSGAPALPMSGGVGRAIYADRRLGAGDRILPRRARRPQLRRGDRGGAGRRRLLRDRRLLVGADHRHHPEAADALLRRGQWLRNLGALELPDPGRRHREEPRRASATSPSSPATAPSRPRRRELIERAVGHVRGGKGPALLRLTVPRLQGHSFQDTQTYKREELVRDEWARDPLPKLKAHLVGAAAERGGMGRDRGARPRPTSRRRARSPRRAGSPIRSGCSTMSSTTARCRRWAGNGPTAIAPREATRSRGPRGSGSTW